MKNIYLIGMPGCGKSTIGRIISSEIKKLFIDLDLFIVEKTGKSIDELFEKGESTFRKAEAESLKEVSGQCGVIVATGGGIVTVGENIDVMKKSGRVIFINTPVERIIKNSSLDGRPLLKDKSKIFELYEKRRNLYLQAADAVIDNLGSAKEAAENILKII